jgi:hypothetical protein
MKVYLLVDMLNTGMIKSHPGKLNGVNSAAPQPPLANASGWDTSQPEKMIENDHSISE